MNHWEKTALGRVVNNIEDWKPFVDALGLPTNLLWALEVNRAHPRFDDFVAIQYPSVSHLHSCLCRRALVAGSQRVSIRSVVRGGMRSTTSTCPTGYSGWA